MAKLQAKTKENPKLMQKTLADGRQSLYLEYYMGYNKVIDEVTGKEHIKHPLERILGALPASQSPHTGRTPKEQGNVSPRRRNSHRQGKGVGCPSV